MKRTFFFTSILCFFALLFSTTPASADMEQLEFDDLVHLADIIFTGTVSDQTCRVGENRVTLFTNVSFTDVELIHKKETVSVAAGDDISLTYFGGQLGEVYQRVSDMPSFEVGQRYLVFSYYDGRPHSNPLVGGNQGLFKLTSDAVTGTQYPLKLNGMGIAALQNGKFSFAPRLKKIVKGLLEFAETQSEIKMAPPPRTPLGWPYPAKTRKTSLPSKILSLNELTAQISATLAQEPPAAVVEKLAARAISKPQADRRAADINYLDRAWEFSDDGKLIVLDETRVKCRTPKTKSTNSPRFTTLAPTYEDVHIKGWMDLPLIMEMVPESYSYYDHDTRALGKYNMYIDNMARYRPKDGGWYINGYSEFCGIITSDEMWDAYLQGWDSSDTRGMAITTGGTCYDCEIFEADIMLNAAINWTYDYRCQLYRTDPGDCFDAILYEKTLVHELGHAFGLQRDGEDYAYDVPTVMNGNIENTVENSDGLHVADTNLLRRWYKDQRNDSDMNHEDIGVESWFADGGALNSVDIKGYFTPDNETPKYAPGENIELYNITADFGIKAYTLD